MRYTVRKAFETNSSSMHSIIIKKTEGKSGTEDIYSDKVLNLYSSDLHFGTYPFRILRTFLQKLEFAVASYSNSFSIKANDFDKIEELKNIVKEKLGLELRLPTTTLEEYRRADNHKWISGFDIEWISDPDDTTSEICIYKDDPSVEIEYRKVEVVDADIDHQSAGLLQMFMDRYNVTLEEFLTNSKYIVIIDGDEYCEFDNIRMSGILNTENIEEQFPEQMTFDCWEYTERNKK